MRKTALICGVSGQDGALLAKLLLGKGYHVVGTSRDAKASSFSNLERLGIRGEVDLISMSLRDFRSVLQVLDKTKPDEVYNLAGQSSVGLSFENPLETFESHALVTLNILEAIRSSGGGIRLFNAGSGECFGDTGENAAHEHTPFYPRSPYAVAKVAAFWEVANYREAYDLHVCSGILFNHESFLRPEKFVTKKIVKSACRIAKGSKEKLILGNLSIKRDWGWAEEYVDAMWRMLQQDEAEDFVISTGQSNSLEDFTEEVFSCLGLSWKEHVYSDSSFFRVSDAKENKGDPSRAKEKLGWTPSHYMKDVARKLVDCELPLV